MKRFLGFILVALIGVLSQVAPSPAVAAATSVVGVMERKSVTYTNSQTIDYTFSSVAIVGASGSEFQYLSTTCLATFSQGGSCTVSLNFTPKFEGIRTAQVRLYVAGSNLGDFQRIDLSYLASGTCTDQTFDSGTGTATDPFGIATREQLVCINATNDGALAPRYLDKSFVLKNDIALTSSNSELPSIGSKPNPFTGSFDGNGYEISGFEIRGLEAGMFGKLGVAATVKNFEIINATIESESRAGTLSVESEGAIVTNVQIIGGSVTSVKGWHVGGLIGSAAATQIKNSSSSAMVSITSDSSDHSCLGGLVGLAKVNTTITSSYATGNVAYLRANGVREYSAVGGLVGAVYTSEVSRSYALGSVTSDSEFANSGVASFVGEISGGTLTQNFAAGLVADLGANASVPSSSARQRVGGFVGKLLYTNNLSGNLWDKEKTGQITDPANILTAPALGKVDPKTSAELTSLSTFTAAGWEFEAAVGSDNYWVLLPTSYPTLVNRPFLNVPGATINPLAEPAALPTPQAPPTNYYSEPSYAPQASFTAKGRITTLKRTSEIAFEGGSGQGVVTYKSLTEAICAVDANGVISGLSAGECEVEVGKAADGFYLAATTTMVVQVLTPYQKLWQAPEGITSDDIQSIRGRYLSYLRSDLFQQLSTTALSALSSKQIKLITKRQFATLNQDQRKALKR